MYMMGTECTHTCAQQQNLQCGLLHPSKLNLRGDSEPCVSSLMARSLGVEGASSHKPFLFIHTVTVVYQVGVFCLFNVNVLNVVLMISFLWSKSNGRCFFLAME